MKRFNYYIRKFEIIALPQNLSWKAMMIFCFVLFLESNISAQISASGNETIANTVTANSQQHPKIAADTLGNFVTVWESFNQDGDDYGIFGQLFASDGTKSGSPFQVNTTTANGQIFPDVAMDEDGNFTVVWMSDKEDGDGFGIYIRGYDNTGISLFGPSIVNTSTAGEQKFPSVSTGGGNTIVTWMEPQNDGDIFARIFDSNGNPSAPPFLVNAATTGFQGFPVVAVDSTGNFVVAWQDNVADGDGIGIQAQLFDDSGNTVGAVIPVNTTTTGNQQEPQVAKTADGNFAVSWSSYGQDGDHFGVFARLFDETGSPLTGEVQVNTETVNAQENESIIATWNNKYAVSWSSYNQDSSFTGAYMQLLNDDGSLFESELRLNTNKTGFQHFSDLAASKSKLQAVWQDGLRNSTETNDGSDYGIFFQQFTFSNPPTAVCQDITVYLDGSGSASISGEDIDGGSTDDIGIASYSAGPSLFSCTDIGDNPVTLTVTNVFGNTATCSATVTVVDTVSPVVICKDISIDLAANGLASISAADIDNASTDNCNQFNLSIDITDFDCSNRGENTVMLTATDDSGNSSFCFATVTVNDPLLVCCQPPEIICPSDVTVECGSNTSPDVTGTPDVIANCGLSDLTSKDTMIYSCGNTGYILRTWTATDINNDFDICTQVITVIDTTAPAAPTPPADVFVNCASDIPPPVQLTAIDNCDDSITVSPNIYITPGACPNDFVEVRVWVFTDVCGNSSVLNQTITVWDTLAPVLPTAPPDLVLDCVADVPPPVNLTAIDNCDDSITVSPTIQITPGDCPNELFEIRTWTFIDTCGNASSIQQTITVWDTLAPVLPTAPPDLVLDCVADIPPPVNLTAIDNCDDSITVSPTIQITPGDCPNELFEIRTWTFIDTCGNASSIQQTITVWDTLAPVAPTPPADLFLDCMSDYPPPVNLTATDNCDGEITVGPYRLITPGSCPNDFIEVRTWVFTDTCGNSSAVSQTIIVSDTLAPVAPSPPADLFLACADDVPPLIKLTAIDNCDDSITVSPTQQLVFGDCVNNFTLVRTWTFVDTCGNVSSVSQNITVIDSVAPAAPKPPADLVLDCAADVPPIIKLTAIDNCNDSITVSPTQQFVFGDCVNNFTLVRTWTFVDTCGNVSSVSQNITVIDSVAPAAPTPPADLFLDCAADLPPPIKLTAIDNCNDSITVSPTQQFVFGDCVNNFTLVRTWTFVDTCGNVSSVSQNITVTDSVAPATPTPPADLVLDCAADVPPPIKLTAIDNCNDSITVSPTQQFVFGDCVNNYTLVRTWTFVDTCGNVSSVSQNITVIDSVAPLISNCPASDFVISYTNSGECFYTSSSTEFDITASDNCSSSLNYDYVLSGATSGTGSNSLANVDFNVGTTTVVWTVTDECGNSSQCEFNVTVNQVQTITTVSVSPGIQQYSDSVEFSASVVPWNCGSGSFVGGDVTFYVGTQAIGPAVNIASDGTATATYPLLEIPSYPSNGQMEPGSHLVTAVFNNYNSDFVVNDATTSLDITKENACYSYTGQLFASVGKNYEHNVYMAATIYDDDDGSHGDVRNSMARFIVSDGGVVHTSPWLEIGLVDPNDPSVGQVSYEWIETVLSKTNTSEVYDVKVEMMNDSYFSLCTGEEAVLTIYVPDGEFITGGGYIISENPDGFYLADPGSKTNFGFNVKWNKKGTNLQGKMNIIFRSTDQFGTRHVYQIRSNATNSLGIALNNVCDSAEFVSKANMKDVTDPLNTISLGGNLELHVTLSDCSQSGEFDKIGITVYDNNGTLIYSSNWTGYETVKQLIEGGNIVIHSNSNVGSQSTKKGPKSAELIMPDVKTINLKVYPNPFTEKLKFDFVSPKDTYATIEIYDITGQKINTVFDGPIEKDFNYIIEYVPFEKVSGMYFYRVNIGGSIVNGNVIYKE